MWCTPRVATVRSGRLAMALKYSLASICRIGARPVNQDRVGHLASDGALLTVVADGMGGHPRGEVAAQIAVDQLIEDFAEQARPKLARPAVFLVSAFRRAHGAITRAARDMGIRDAPRAVLVACVLQDGAATFLHAGDARLYLLRRGRIALRSKDDSFVQRLIDRGQMDEAFAAVHPDRNIVLKCVGGDEVLRLRRPTRIELETDDVVMLCSDGFWGPLLPQEIAQGLRGEDLDVELDRLARRAEKRAGLQCDNVSVAAVRWDERTRRPRGRRSTKTAENLPAES